MGNEEKILEMLIDLTKAIDNTRTELKAEIQGVRTELKEEIQGVRTELKEEIQGVRTELKEEIQGVRTELKAEIQGVRTELETEIRENRKEIIKIENKIESEISDKICGLYDSREVTNDKLDKISNDIGDIKETISNVELITASNWRDLTKLKSIK
ncbi:hypothetical protein [Lutispora saccharofermentans]|uniref:Uncharacterized protein n=1 Tax=Lutispora saccharofermentans TaxID=3024236 RepID=A0ABT1NG98_9FIRM|nr:hypothetical protein [Lutispora saccharofermentans]MCQ1530282.1 hypothetical protein [Lutispora saccharofermentans]